MKMRNSLAQKHQKFLRIQKNKKIFTLIIQISVLCLFLAVWEAGSRVGLIDAFLVSSPSRIFKTLIELNFSGALWSNVMVTVLETMVGFIFGTFLGILLASILWWSKTLEKIAEPYLVIFNALPKVALGPIIIVWMGAGTLAIVVMSLLISVIITTIHILSGFKNAEMEKILLMKSLGANKFQIFKKIILPVSLPNVISVLKVNIGMSLIGVITGEFLVAKKGIGYLIVYGSQIFKLDLVMAGIFILAIIASMIYFLISNVKPVNKF
ncbi:MAG: ABC transporter permease [Oscillospiraceae bacterium]|jgi:NitT/TauT family transport system permease protein|nr:ABC transporter permease [Oscillospiraceae bacterium]